MLANILSQLGVNTSLWSQLAIFMALYIFLRAVYFGPFLKLLELREKESTGSEKEANELLQKALKCEEEYKNKISLIRKQANENKEALLAKAKKEAMEQIAKVRAQNKANVERVREQLLKEAGLGIGERETGANQISKLFLEKLLKAKAEL